MDVIDQLLDNYIKTNKLQDNFLMHNQLKKDTRKQKPRLGYFTNDIKHFKIVRQK